MMIGIGGYYLGPELQGSPINRFLNCLAKTVVAVTGEWREGDAPSVVVVFVVPGSLGGTTFSGQRTTLFSRRKKLLQVEVAVPWEVVTLGGSAQFAIDALHKANAIAAETFARKGPEPFDLAKAEAIVDRVRDVLTSQADLTARGPSPGSER